MFTSRTRASFVCGLLELVINIEKGTIGLCVKSLFEAGKHHKRTTIVGRDSIILAPLHLKMGLMKLFVGALDKNHICLECICSTFYDLSIEKPKAGIFTDIGFAH